MKARDWKYICDPSSGPGGPYFKLIGNEIHLLERPIIVERDLLLVYTDREQLDDYNILTVDVPYTDDLNRQRSFTLVLTAMPFGNSYAVISEAAITAATGYKKYGPKVARQVYDDLRSMEASKQARVLTDGNTTRVLKGISERGEFIYDDILATQEATLLVKHSPHFVAYSYAGHIYTSKFPLLMVTHINNLLKEPLRRYGSDYRVTSPIPEYIVIDHLVYAYTPGQIRFRVNHPSLPDQFPVVDVVVTEEVTEASPCALKTLSEVRAYLEYSPSPWKEEALEAFEYVHPDLQGKPLPQIHEGDTVMVSIQDPADPKNVLNGAVGKVVSTSRLFSRVEFLGYREFVAELHNIDLIPVNNTTSSSEK